MVQLVHNSQANSRLHADVKTPPHSVEAEQAVLGGLMMSDQAWDWICDRVSEADFYRQDHRLIFQTIAALAEQGKPRDVVTMSEWLEQRGELEKAGGIQYLGRLVSDTPSAANVKAYADIVRERSVLRQMIQVGEEIAADAYSPGDQEISHLLDAAESRVYKIYDQIKSGKFARSFISMRQALSKALDRLDERFHAGSKITGIPTGFDAFDELTRGLQKANLIILAARPSMGKSTMMMNIVEHAAIRNKKSCAVFSMEMAEEEITDRTISSISRVPFERIQNGQLEDGDWPKVTAATTLLMNAPIYIDDTPALTVSQVRARCRRIKREHGLDLIAIDYLQLMEAVDKKQNYAQQIGEISRGLKAIAKEFNVPVLALAQLNRNVDSRAEKRPQMSDLRDSGNIEQDADIIVFIYREAAYNEHTKFPNVAEALIRKARNAKTGKVYLTSMLHIMKFENSHPEIAEYEAYIRRSYDGKGGLD